MAQNTYKTTKKTTVKKKPWRLSIHTIIDKRFVIALGILLQGTSIFLCIAFLSHLTHGHADQSVIESAHDLGLRASGAEIHNWLGLLGAMSAYYMMFRWWGITAFLLLLPTYLLGYRLTYGQSLGAINVSKSTVSAIFGTLWLNIALGYAAILAPEAKGLQDLVGGVGFELGLLSSCLLGWGTFIVLAISLLVFGIFFFNITQWPSLLNIVVSSSSPSVPALSTTTPQADRIGEPIEEAEVVKEQPHEEAATRSQPANILLEIMPNQDPHTGESLVTEAPALSSPVFTVAPTASPEQVMETTENYDPTLDLSSYQYPDVHLLDEHAQAKVSIDQAELESNKDKIIETLTNFKIHISSIKATIGPTVTLYEIVPEAGIKISRIKNLEDDIALSLAALGIRIIAPIPGKGTIGIEVPNKHREIVPLRAMMATEKFMRSSMELPLIMGKTIANEILIADLTRMPHLLIAGATGQGKSVGLNVLLTSLIYKKHPSQLKLVLVDPKKVELSLYNKLERHFLAKLPGDDEAIITETKKVVNTLNSLCLEMDQRYELLKEAGVRNIEEYNKKFVRRGLNPEKGHRFLQYIVLVVDEFADMMMTAGKEVETPIARLAQLARAVGIHLILATQRPSVNVITGIIKANFPVRMSYRVTSRIDSRTILDAGGAEQLVGRGDTLLSMNSEITRLQCPFLDTAEVERICEYIGSQRGYASAYLLPAYDDEQEDREEVDLGEKDPMFEEAARLIVAHQQGSTSLIQRKLKLGYNRAGRLVDQLEAAGIVGPFEGSKAREVLVPDEYSLEHILKGMEA